LTRAFAVAPQAKVFTIASIPSNVALEDVREHLPDEVPATLKLYLEGKVEQFWFRENMGRSS